MSLTPEVIQERSSSGEISKNLALEQLTVLIENSENDSLRLKSLNTVQELNFRNEDLYNLLEHLLPIRIRRLQLSQIAPGCTGR